MPNITVQEVTVDTVKTGKRPYNVATLVYTSERGENKSKKIMSFSNPAVFEAARNAKQGEVYAITYVQGDQYYNFATMERVAADAAPAARKEPGSAVAKVLSTYETAEERKIKQLYIVRQSSIANAIEILKHNNPKGLVNPDDALTIAETFVNFVYGTEETLAAMDSNVEALPQE